MWINISPDLPYAHTLSFSLRTQFSVMSIAISLSECKIKGNTVISPSVCLSGCLSLSQLLPHTPSMCQSVMPRIFMCNDEQNCELEQRLQQQQYNSKKVVCHKVLIMCKRSKSSIDERKLDELGREFLLY